MHGICIHMWYKTIKSPTVFFFRKKKKSALQRGACTKGAIEGAVTRSEQGIHAVLLYPSERLQCHTISLGDEGMEIRDGPPSFRKQWFWKACRLSCDRRERSCPTGRERGEGVHPSGLS